MPIDPKVIAEAGSWAFLVAVLVAFIVAGATALRRRWFVPGWIFDRAEKRAAKAEAEAQRNARSLASQANSQAAMAAAYTALVARHDAMDERLSRIEAALVNNDAT